MRPPLKIFWGGNPGPSSNRRVLGVRLANLELRGIRVMNHYLKRYNRVEPGAKSILSFAFFNCLLKQRYWRQIETIDTGSVYINDYWDC